jgi:hypothetical protein
VKTDLATAIAHVAETAKDDRNSAFHAGANLLRHSHRRETEALGGIPRMAPGGRAAALAAAFASEAPGALTRDLQALEQAWSAITGNPVPDRRRTADEEKLAGLVYTRTGDVGAWQDAMERVKAVEGLHPMMQFEAYNFADGRRTALEVYEAVAAEALSAGRWYYGAPTPEQIGDALERAAKAGALTVTRRP